MLVTLGAEGSYLLEEDGRETRIPGDKTVQAVDTTAAGDSYLAGVCVALSQGKDLPQAAALASAVSLPGGDPPGGPDLHPGSGRGAGPAQQLDP